LTSIFLDSQQNVGKYANKLDFSPKQYFAVLLFKVSAWLFIKVDRKTAGIKIKAVWLGLAAPNPPL
jgi:hypothetical protein